MFALMSFTAMNMRIKSIVIINHLAESHLIRPNPTSYDSILPHMTVNWLKWLQTELKVCSSSDLSLCAVEAVEVLPPAERFEALSAAEEVEALPATGAVGTFPDMLNTVSMSARIAPSS